MFRNKLRNIQLKKKDFKRSTWIGLSGSNQLLLILVIQGTYVVQSWHEFDFMDAEPSLLGDRQG